MALKQNIRQNQDKQKFPEQPEMEAGTYPARLVQIIDMGLQPQRPYKGDEKKPANEVMLTYEFVDVFMVDDDGNEVEDKPRWFSEILPWYGPEAAKAKSAQRYAAFDPNNDYDGDLGQCIEVPVNVTIVINKSNGKSYVNIASVTAMRKRDADKVPALVNPPKVFDLDDPDMEVFNKLPGWIQDKLKGNLRYAGSKLEKALTGNEQQEEEKPKDEGKPNAKPPKKADPQPEGDEDEDAPW